MRKQRYTGIALVAISWLILLLALTGTTPVDQDATAAVLTLPLGSIAFHGSVHLVP